MKNSTILSIFLFAAMGFLFACNSKQTADQYLKDDNQRKAIIAGIANHQPYRADMINEMMNSDSSKQMMAHSMMGDPSSKIVMMDNMMNMCKNDASMWKMMMDKTMEMCEGDTAKSNMMMQSMQSHPDMMNRMQGKDDMKMMPNK